MVIGLGAALLGAALFGVGAVVQAVAVRRHGLFSRMMAVVVVVYVIGWLFHLVAIALTPLYVAQVGTAFSLAITALVASRVVREPLAPRHWAAIVAQVGGLALLALAAGDVGSHDVASGDAWALVVALVVLAGLGVLAVRRPAAQGGLLLAALAGLAYAGSPDRFAGLLDPSRDLATVAAALTIGLYGLLGFWLYSIALDRISITAATAPVVLLQTVVPAVVGVVALGDGIRGGWGPVALLGFVIATSGALVLCGAEERLEHLQEVGPDPVVGWRHDQR